MSKCGLAFLAGVVACLVAIAAVGWLARAKAEEQKNYLTVACFSYHLERHKGYRENNNPCIGYERKFTDEFRGMAGMYPNSIGRDSHYAAFAWLPIYIAPLNLRLGGAGGCTDGYGKRALCAILPMIVYEDKAFGVGFGLDTLPIPPMEVNNKKTGGVIGFKLKYLFQ